ncbi:MAG: OsmC family protein [Chloroflexi bacterium]|nr:OsmC family protein [Chloroflexota bacterium]
MPASRVNLRDLQAPLKAEYQDNPDAARITLRVKSRSSDLTDPLHCAISPEAAPDLVWQSGAHAGVGGAGDVPCSGDLLLGALAACQEITVRMVAAAMGIELEELEVEAIGQLDLRGTLGVDRAAPVGFTNIRCETRVAVKDDGRPERARRLLENAERYCVVLNTLRAGVPVESSFALQERQSASA